MLHARPYLPKFFDTHFLVLGHDGWSKRTKEEGLQYLYGDDLKSPCPVRPTVIFAVLDGRDAALLGGRLNPLGWEAKLW
jgi:hypothetical protein